MQLGGSPKKNIKKFISTTNTLYHYKIKYLTTPPFSAATECKINRFLTFSKEVYFRPEICLCLQRHPRCRKGVANLLDSLLLPGCPPTKVRLTCAGYVDWSGTFVAGCFCVCLCGISLLVGSEALYWIVGDCPYITCDQGISSIYDILWHLS